MTFTRTLLTALGLTLAVPAAAADAIDAGPRPVAVQNRQHTMRHEYLVAVGVLPMDAFTKGLTFTGAYTLHFTDLVGWEIVQFTYALPVDTNLKDELANLPEPVGPTPFEVVEYYATSNVVFKPIYGKMTWLNKRLIAHEVYLVAGAGVGRLTVSTRPVVDAGIGMRLFSSQHLSFRLDVRDYLFFNTDDLDNEIWVALGMSLDFGG